MAEENYAVSKEELADWLEANTMELRVPDWYVVRLGERVAALEAEVAALKAERQEF